MIDGTQSYRHLRSKRWIKLILRNLFKSNCLFDIDEREKIYYDMIVYSFKFLDFIPAIEVHSKIDYNLSFKGLEWKYQFSS